MLSEEIKSTAINAFRQASEDVSPEEKKRLMRWADQLEKCDVNRTTKEARDQLSFVFSRCIPALAAALVPSDSPDLQDDDMDSEEEEGFRSLFQGFHTHGITEGLRSHIIGSGQYEVFQRIVIEFQRVDSQLRQAFREEYSGDDQEDDAEEEF